MEYISIMMSMVPFDDETIILSIGVSGFGYVQRWLSRCSLLVRILMSCTHNEEGSWKRSEALIAASW